MSSSTAARVAFVLFLLVLAVGTALFVKSELTTAMNHISQVFPSAPSASQ